MAERRPPGFNVDLGFYDSDEVMSIPRKIRAAAIGVWTLCGSYSANKLTDGYVSAEVLRDRGCTTAIRAALIATKPAPLWVPGDDVGGIQFTRWPKWQRTSAEVKAYREADAERKRRAREAKRGPSTSDNAQTSGRTPAGQPQPVRPDSGTPKTETKTETKTEVPSVALVVGDVGGEVEKPTAANRTRGTRIPDGWIPAEDVIAQMRSDHPHIDLKAEHVKFIDYWQGKAGRDARKADWNATWRNWIRRADEHGPRNGTSTNGIGKPTQKALGWEAVGAELIAEMESQ